MRRHRIERCPTWMLILNSDQSNMRRERFRSTNMDAGPEKETKRGLAALCLTWMLILSSDQSNMRRHECLLRDSPAVSPSMDADPE
jgi:hypothetical protein